MRPQRSFNGERAERPQRSFNGERAERPQRSFNGERTERPQRSFNGERTERPQRSFNGERTERPSRPSFGGRPKRNNGVYSNRKQQTYREQHEDPTKPVRLNKYLAKIRPSRFVSINTLPTQVFVPVVRQMISFKQV